jgi:tetratricopeptide (TPR) repeat protein
MNKSQVVQSALAFTAGWQVRARARSWASTLTVMMALVLGCAPKDVVRPDPLEQARQQMLAVPQDAGVYFHLAELYLDRHDYLRARQYLALLERNQSAWATAGIEEGAVFRLSVLCAVRSQQYIDAIERCQRRLETGEDLGTRVLLATLLEALGDESAAERQRRLILLQHPQDHHQIIEAARFYERSLRMDRLTQAQELYRRYLTAAPTGPEAGQARAALETQRLAAAVSGE